MRYTAAALSDAKRPVTITIGRVSNRRGWRWLSRWWVARCRTFTSKPLSVEQMLTLQAAGDDPLRYLLALAPVLDAVFPRRWWYRLTGNPVRLVLRLPQELVRPVLKALVTVPGTERDVSEETEDPIEMYRRAHRQSVYGDTAAGGGGVSLAVAALSVRAAYGDAWYFNPQRWPTSDGYVPFAVALVEHAGMQALEMRRRLEVADGFTLSHAKPHEKERMHRLAYPQEVC